MISGIGTDIVSVNRIASMKQKEAFVKKILSENEKQRYESFKNATRQNEFLAGRWAVKEALYKALGERCKNMKYTDFEISNTSEGKPFLAKPEISHVHLSISHCREYAQAFVVYEILN